MATQDARGLEYLCREFGQGADAALLRRLINRGLIDMRAAERGAVRERVAELQSRGAKRVDAMYQAAEEFCCSYEKIRSIIYCKLKNP